MRPSVAKATANPGLAAGRGEMPRSSRRNASSFNGSLWVGRCVLVAVLAMHAAGCSTGTARAQQSERPAVKEERWPIVKLPLDVVEPPRNVPAARWNSPYCGHWGDGCTECTRTVADEAPQCHAEKDRSPSACKPRAIICLKEYDPAKFNRICSNFFIESYSGPVEHPADSGLRRGDILADAEDYTVEWRGDGPAAKSERIPFPSEPVNHALPWSFEPEKFIIRGDDLIDVTGPDPVIGPFGTPYVSEFIGPPYGRAATGLRCWRTYADGVTGGLTEATAARLAGPPIIKLPLEVMEPSRNVEAARWVSPYCGRWDDGCEECVRGASSGAIECHEFSHKLGECVRRTIMCRRLQSDEKMASLCTHLASASIFASDSSAFTGGVSQVQVYWRFDSSGQWRFRIHTYEDHDRARNVPTSLVPPYLPPPSGVAVRSIGSSFICLGPYN